MTSDFVISRAGAAWHAFATSARAKAFAADHARFRANKADLDPSEVLAAYEKLHSAGYYASVPDGLPPPESGHVLWRLALVLGLIVAPLTVFALLV